MPSNKPWLDPPSARSRAKDKIWQGGICLLIGVVAIAATYLAFGMVWILSVIIALAGLFWLLTGLVTLLTGHE